MIDGHCHLADKAFQADLPDVVARAQEAGIARVLCVLAAGVEEEALAAPRLRALWPQMQFTVGVHPHHAGRFEGRESEAATLVRADVAREAADAIGEIGLDYHYDYSPRAVQQVVFAAQIALAREMELPVVIHSRDASEDTLAIIREAGQGAVRGVFHCFAADRATARLVLDLDFYISLSGIVTFPRAEELREVARLVPDERLLVETDAPYLAPVPHRGTRNEPAFVVRVLDEVARLRARPATELGAQVIRNYDALLGPNGRERTV